MPADDIEPHLRTGLVCNKLARVIQLATDSGPKEMRANSLFARDLHLIVQQSCLKRRRFAHSHTRNLLPVCECHVFQAPFPRAEATPSAAGRQRQTLSWETNPIRDHADRYRWIIF